MTLQVLANISREADTNDFNITCTFVHESLTKASTIYIWYVALASSVLPPAQSGKAEADWRAVGHPVMICMSEVFHSKLSANHSHSDNLCAPQFGFLGNAVLSMYNVSNKDNNQKQVTQTFIFSFTASNELSGRYSCVCKDSSDKLIESQGVLLNFTMPKRTLTMTSDSKHSVALAQRHIDYVTLHCFADSVKQEIASWTWQFCFPHGVCVNQKCVNADQNEPVEMFTGRNRYSRVTCQLASRQHSLQHGSIVCEVRRTRNNANETQRAAMQLKDVIKCTDWLESWLLGHNFISAVIFVALALFSVLRRLAETRANLSLIVSVCSAAVAAVVCLMNARFLALTFVLEPQVWLLYPALVYLLAFVNACILALVLAYIGNARNLFSKLHSHAALCN